MNKRHIDAFLAHANAAAYQLFDGPKHLDGAFVNVVAYLQYRCLKCRISQIPQPLGG